jgi:hypothetical protein
MSTDLRVILDDSPGGLAGIGEALGAAGVNIQGLCGVTHDGVGIIHILVEDGAAARQALEGAGIDVEGETDVIVGELPQDVDQPGTLGAMARKVSDAGVNVTVAYLATGNRVVIGTSDNAKAQEALASGS